MIKAYCDRCEKEIAKDIKTEYFVDINVSTTGWVGNRNATYYSRDYVSSEATRRFWICDECLSKFSDMVISFMELQQKEENEG